jgi:hypothetical protein
MRAEIVICPALYLDTNNACSGLSASQFSTTEEKSWAAAVVVVAALDGSGEGGHGAELYVNHSMQWRA